MHTHIKLELTESRSKCVVQHLITRVVRSVVVAEQESGSEAAATAALFALFAFCVVQTRRRSLVVKRRRRCKPLPVARGEGARSSSAEFHNLAIVLDRGGIALHRASKATKLYR